MASSGFPRPPYGERYRPEPIQPHRYGSFIRLRRPRRFDRTYRAGADHYVVRLFGWRLIVRLEPDPEAVSDGE
jgi:hypothetical protein